MNKLLALLVANFMLVQIVAVRVQVDFEGNVLLNQSLYTNGDEAKQSIDTGRHMFECTPTADQPPAKVSDTRQMKTVLSGVKSRLGISSWTWVIGYSSPLFVAGVHGTTTFALASMLTNGIKVSTELRATGRSLLSDGFYMYSMGWGYEGETQDGISHMIAELHHYCGEAQTGLKRAVGYRNHPGAAPNPAKVAAKQAFLASKKDGKGDSWVDRVIIFLGASRSLPDGHCTYGFSLRGKECAAAYTGAKQRQDDNRYVYFGEIPKTVGYVVGPKIPDKAVELVAKSAFASNLAVLGYYCVTQRIYVKASAKLAGVPPHCLCSPCKK